MDEFSFQFSVSDLLRLGLMVFGEKLVHEPTQTKPFKVVQISAFPFAALLIMVRLLVTSLFVFHLLLLSV